MDFTHFNEEGRARMVDVSEKPQTQRTATAEGVVRLNSETFKKVVAGRIKRGDVLAVAQVAGIMAAKKTWESIPVCHPLALTGVDINFELDPKKHTITICATTRCKGETGVEMEALQAVSTAALTVYDMCKALQKDIIIDGIQLTRKTGGASGDYRRDHGTDNGSMHQ